MRRTSAKNIARDSLQLVNRSAALLPAPFSAAYVEAWSFLARKLNQDWISDRIRNSVCDRALSWKVKEFAARDVIVGEKTTISLHPHIGEFDADALFRRRLAYEYPVFAWLEKNAAQRYDVVIEIGANVGVYSCFLDRLRKEQAPGRLTRVVAFEPSREAFRRLQDNLRANDASIVLAFNLAIGTASEFIAFFEPDEHLTNGSLIRDFSAIFSDSIAESIVFSLEPQQLRPLFAEGHTALIKIDVEGFEPQLLTSMEQLIRDVRPDLLIEVLDISAAALAELNILSEFDKFLVEDDGLHQHDDIFAHPHARDWLLVHKSRSL